VHGDSSWLTVIRSSVLGVSIVVDRLYYGIWTFPPLKFLYFNIAQSLAVFYGRNDWHYYLSQGLPLLLTTALPFAVVGLYDSLRPSGTAIDRRVAIKQQLATVCMIMPLVLSLIAHKEVRFIYPLLPALHVLAAEPLVSFFLPAISSSSSAYVPRRLVLIFLLLVNVFVAYYTTITHASGPLNVLSYLRERHQAHHESSHALETRHPLFGSFTTPPDASSKNMSVGFLMPCHSTPWRSHLVFPSIDAWALSCEPPIGLNETQKLLYLDEADQFYEKPTDFLQHHMVGGLRHVPRTPSYLAVPRAPTSYLAPPLKSSSLHEWPDYLIFFAQLEPTLHTALRSSSYGECWRTWNTGWHDDWRRRGDIVVWCLDPAEQSDWHKTQHQKLRAKREQQFDRVVSGLVKKAKKSSAPSSGSSSSNSRRLWDISSYFQQKSSSSNASPWYSSLWPFSSFSSHPPPSRFTSWTHLLPGTKPKKKFPYLPDFLQGKKGTEQSSSLSSFWSSWWPSKKSKQPSSTSPSEQNMPGFLDRELWN
jgi:phosphatidylinositol glycan class B